MMGSSMACRSSLRIGIAPLGLSISKGSPSFGVTRYRTVGAVVMRIRSYSRS